MFTLFDDIHEDIDNSLDVLILEHVGVGHFGELTQEDTSIVPIAGISAGPQDQFNYAGVLESTMIHNSQLLHNAYHLFLCGCQTSACGSRRCIDLIELAYEGNQDH